MAAASGSDPTVVWHRDHPGRRVAGVCAALAHYLGVPLVIVRAAFILAAFLHGFGILAYLVLWFLMPDRPGAPSGLDRTLDFLRSLFGGETSRGESRGPGPD